MKLDKKWFYENLKPFDNKYKPIFINMSLSKDDLRYRLVFAWSNRKPNGDFNSIMSAQLIDTTKTVGHGKYVVPDLFIDCIKENITTDYKLYKRLNEWIENAFKEREQNDNN